MKHANILEEELERRILLLDGGFGTMVQGYGLAEADYRDELFRDHAQQLKGCNDLLALTQPGIVREIHEKYLAAGADIVTTDSFNANAVSLADYGLEARAREIARAAARTARAAADAWMLRNPQRPRFVAGSMGPTNHTLSLSSKVEAPAERDLDFARLEAAYYDQACGLIEGGVDLVMLETFFDTLNAKAAIHALERLFDTLGRRLPVIVSGTLTPSGRTLSGQTVEAFCVSVAHARPLAVSLNCSFGAKQLLPYLERLAATAQCRVAVYPNAGLPNVMGGYDETPAMFAEDVAEYMRRGLVNIVGGCCGTTPAHIFELSKIVSGHAPRPLPAPRHVTVLSGLEPLRIVPEANFVNVGERTNVAGSARFARLIRERRYEEALAVARAQVEAGAQLVDVCMDDGLIDGPEAMRTFLNLMASEPEIARVPVMIDSSKWEVLEAGLQCVQGKAAVNSVSLKEGEAELLRRARAIRRYGAAVVVMLFDERGQADTFERKIEVAERAYRLLTEDGFPPEEIIFDPNVLAVATGIAEHDGYAKAFIDATRWIRTHLPHAKVSGGVSNLSFAFRGNNAVREAMHAAFLYHAVGAGMDMGIVNPQMLKVYDQIEPELLERVEDTILCRRTDAAERLAEYAQGVKASGETAQRQPDGTPHGATLRERIEYAMLRGADERIEQDATEAYETLGDPLAVIDTLLMPAMERVGQLFGEGKMFLPQVVKTARTMKRAVAALTPYIEQGTRTAAGKAGRVLIATVKGDVHDIGKNIVSVVMACNGYEIVDLGVMVESQRIADEAEARRVDCICLSGLITPSLDEMARVCEELERRGLRIPVVIGGATTSAVHTAVKLAPLYGGVVIHSTDAGQNIRILGQLRGPERDRYIDRVRAEQAALRAEYQRAERQRKLVPLDEARRGRRIKPAAQAVRPLHTGRMVFPDFDIADAEPFIDWNFFFPAWGLKGRYPELLDHPEKGAEARKLLDDARALLGRIRDGRLLTLQGVAGIFPARSDGDDIVVTDTKGRDVTLPMLRNQTRGEENRSLADFIAPEGDWIGAFALTGGIGLKELCAKFRDEGDDYSAILAKLLADRLTEAFAEAVHTFVRRQMWGYETGTMTDPQRIVRGEYRGRRMAFGYPASPDHSLKREVFDLLAAGVTTGMKLTDNCMIDPGESLCGLLFADADYFSVGRIGDEQLRDYARRRGTDEARIRKLLPNNL